MIAKVIFGFLAHLAIASLNIDGSSFTIYPVNGNFEECIYEDETGNLWFGSYDDDGIVKFDGTNWTYFLSEIPNFNGRVYSICGGSNSSIYISTDYGIKKYDGTSWTEFSLPDPNLWTPEIFYDSQENTWFATYNNGFYRHDGNNWDFFSLEEVTLDYCNDITEDQNGNIWFGGRHHIVKFDGTNWTPYTADDGLACAAGFVYSIYADSNGDIWTGSNSSGVTKYSDPSLVFINPIDQTVSTNEIFNTSIEIAGVQNLGSFELELDFDPAFLQANTVTIGSFLGSTGRQVFPLSNNIDNANGLVEFAATTLGATPPGPDGDGILLNIEWTSASNISDETIADLILQNLQITQPSGAVLPVNSQNATVIISPCYQHDFDCDCDVDIVDVTMAAFAYGTETGDPNYNPTYDLDSDGDIDIVDITMVTYDYGWTCSKKEAIALLEGTNNENVLLGFEVNKQETINNDIFEMELSVKNIQQLGGYEFEFAFNPQSIEILSVEYGGFLESTHRETLPLQNSIDVKQGEVHISMATLGANLAGASGQGVLIKLRCKALKAEYDTPTLTKAQLVRIDAKVIDYTYKSLETESANSTETYIVSSYPSPFKDKMTIQYNVGRAGNISFKIYDMYGELISQTEPIYTKAGEYIMAFNRAGLNHGIYIYSLVYESKIVCSKRVVIIK